MKKQLSNTPLLLSGVAGSAVLLKPSAAAAHLVTTGMGPVYDGIGHFLLTPEGLIPVFALALYAGLRGTAPGRRALFFLPLAWFVGGVGALMASGIPAYPFPALSFLVLGLLVATDLHMGANAVTALALGLGLVHGFLNGTALREGAGVPGLFGIMAITFVLIALTSAFVVSLRRPWALITVRVVGSWISASGLLMLGWFLKGQG